MGLQRLKLALAPPLWHLLQSTLRVPDLHEICPALETPCIFACLHRDILGSILFVKPARPSLLVSESDDGLILVRTLKDRHYRFIRGATGENGGRALVTLRRALEKGHSIGLAVDGPRGPFGKVYPGGLQLARLTGAPIVPLRPIFTSSLILNTWDRTVVPRPWSRFTMEVGPCIRLQADADDQVIAAHRESLAHFFLQGVGA